MVLDDLAGYLQTAGLGTLAVDLFLGESPASPDRVTILREYAGLPPAYVHASLDPGYEYLRCQVECRATDYGTARQQAANCLQQLGRIVNQIVGTGRYLRVQPLQSPFPLGLDDGARARFVVNFAVIKAA